MASAGCASGGSPSAGSTMSHLVSPSSPAHAVAAAAPAAAAPTGVRHVFLIVLENESYSNTFRHNPHRYLGHTLRKQGLLLTHYYAIGHYSLDNYVAMISGQAPNPDTSGDCVRYRNFNGTTANAGLTRSGQAKGSGCVYPKNVKTLANQLSAHHVRWYGFMQDMGNNPSREHRACGVPRTSVLGIDLTRYATARDQYAARHNPFVYFHSLIDSGLCRRHVHRLGALPGMLANPSSSPSFSFITPDLCDDGHDAPCAGKDSKGSRAGGLTSVDHFLSVWVPRIRQSAAYRHGGLIIITSDESATRDTRSCCHERPGPAQALPGETGPGGGRVGALLLGHCVAAGATDGRYYNHYSLLRSLENLFGITTGGTDGNGHLGYAAAAGLRPFGHDVFSRC
jgi:hypothetical protein